MLIFQIFVCIFTLEPEIPVKPEININSKVQLKFTCP